MNLTLLVATVGSGMGSLLGAARLLYGMGRDNALPRGFFGAVDPRRDVPRNNVLFIGVLALAGGLHAQLPARGAELLNFGALIAFMGVNVAALHHYCARGAQDRRLNLLPPLLGFLDLRLLCGGA